MDEREASELLEHIMQDGLVGPARVHLLGDQKTYVVLIQERSYFLWSPDDYSKYLREQAENQQQKQTGLVAV